ncbi:peptidoglycan-binding protein [Kitasatospora sp. NPDC101176]|uniref:peptidoglycan-binding domain-containing protein n=1 Tax=Kitasatospora sp. NPDC101176 TaxID=3364099 RepID=UPI0037F1C93B
MKRFKRKAVAVAAAALVLGSIVTTTTTARAATTQGYINGFGDVTDDWSDEGLLSMSQHADSGATGIWQAVLYMDGFLDESDIDCRFGPKTAEATRQWQAKYLGASEADGVVGNKTFGKASTWLSSVEDTGPWAYFVRYNGDAKTSSVFHRDTTSGLYGIYVNGKDIEGYYNSMSGC